MFVESDHIAVCARAAPKASIPCPGTPQWDNKAGIPAMPSSSVGVTSGLFYRIDRTDVENISGETNTFGLAIGVAAFMF